jgi:hypothetical protein
VECGALTVTGSAVRLRTPGFLLGLFPPGFTPLTSLVGAIALTVLITWMFNNTGGSLIPGSLMHLSINFATAVMGVSESPTLYAVTVGILSVTAVIVVLTFGPTRLARADARGATRFLPATGGRPWRGDPRLPLIEG